MSKRTKAYSRIVNASAKANRALDGKEAHRANLPPKMRARLGVAVASSLEEHGSIAEDMASIGRAVGEQTEFERGNRVGRIEQNIATQLALLALEAAKAARAPRETSPVSVTLSASSLSKLDAWTLETGSSRSRVVEVCVSLMTDSLMRAALGSK